MTRYIITLCACAFFLNTAQATFCFSRAGLPADGLAKIKFEVQKTLEKGKSVVYPLEYTPWDKLFVKVACAFEGNSTIEFDSHVYTPLTGLFKHEKIRVKGSKVIEFTGCTKEFQPQADPGYLKFINDDSHPIKVACKNIE